jgi:segregation and condensation protein A
MDALVAGKAFQIPADLYIPPAALRVILETTFEGPLDLLLYLIRRQNLDIQQINVADITRQYIGYIELMGDSQFELAGEYLVMASMLAEIKSRSLLPQPHNEVNEDEDEDPRVTLIRQLQVYERFKKAAERIDALPRMGRDTHSVCMGIPNVNCVSSQPTVQLDALLVAYRNILSRCDSYEHHLVSFEKLSTRERMSAILARLQEQQFVGFYTLCCPSEGRIGVVVTFLAMLELVKEQLVNVLQAQDCSTIHIALVKDAMQPSDQPVKTLQETM